MQAIIAGEPVEMADFLSHFDFQNGNVQSGPPVGSRLPVFDLKDQNGRRRCFTDLTGPNGLLIVFVRSVNWCGYCRNQLAEIADAVNGLAQRGINVIAIAPDGPALVRKFAEFAQLGYPILADIDAGFCEILGILNTNIPEQVALQNHGRIPFPGHVLLDAEGTIVAKFFTDDLRHRPSATTLAFEHLGASDIAGVVIETAELEVRIWLSSTRLHTGQEIAVRAEFSLRPEWNLYASSVPEPYAPLSLEFSGELIGAQHVSFPVPEEKKLEALGDVLPVYRGVFAAAGRLRLKWSPPVHGSRRIAGLSEVLGSLQTQPGQYELCGTIRYQACSGSSCLPPQRLDFAIPIEILADTDKVESVFRTEIHGEADQGTQ
ncbi:peroxiredoxin family protein [Sphingobium sp. Sx8-8]|uniref:peroxiredoxin family protein n=1 Tax=Sphingobium sp. Sx8-8 TaxID=2933617 RepID=UPI001F5A1802|nr:peroxiredoxin family protein [Sphingobium sp. Sx8-8]